jgi:hypothetical protein
MSEIKDGGSAFPVMWTEIKSDEEGPQITACEPGMTLRDYFAAKAMQSHLITHTDQNTRNIVEWSYQVADEMLACRARSQS